MFHNINNDTALHKKKVNEVGPHTKNKNNTVHLKGKELHIKLRMEMGNVSKRQQPDHRTDNSRKSITCLQYSGICRNTANTPSTADDDTNQKKRTAKIVIQQQNREDNVVHQIKTAHIYVHRK